MKQIRARVTLSGGKLISARNASKIFARATKPTDRFGNQLVKGQSPIDLLHGEPPYYQKWAVRLEKEGYIFRELTNNHGINGHHKTLRGLLVSVLLGNPSYLELVVEVEEAAS